MNKNRIKAAVSFLQVCMDIEKQRLLIALTKILYKEGLISETEMNKTRDIINGNTSEQLKSKRTKKDWDKS